MISNKPLSSEAEITLIGTGGGYGESSVVHIGDDLWIVVDSCRDPKTKKCLPLMYLEEIGVDIANQVCLIVCTHWHDDHILGMSDLLQEAKSAKFCFARPTDVQKFLIFIGLDSYKSKFGKTLSSTNEFSKCLEIINERKSKVPIPGQDKYLYKYDHANGNTSTIVSLSPSDVTIDNFSKRVSFLISDYKSPNCKVPSASPNDTSIVLYLKLQHHNAILGADLEVTTDSDTGWIAIVENSVVCENLATLFKIPHHGSSNGYSPLVWDKLVAKNAISSITPWNKSNRLPELEMLEKYYTHSDKVFLTSKVANLKPKKRTQHVDKLLHQLGCKINEVPYIWGLIRSRIDMTDPHAKWDVQLSPSACSISTLLEM